MTIEKDFRRMGYTVHISRDEMYKAFQTTREFDKLISQIAKVMWDEKVKQYENLSK